MKPLISIIVPVYQMEKHVELCIVSMLNQTYDNIEIIVIDDGSTDQSLRILKKYANEYSHVILLENEHSGLSIARNKGLDIAKGEYITFVDSDDFIHPQMIQTLFENMWDTNSDISIVGWKEVEEDDAKLYNSKWKQTEVSNHPIVVQKLEAIKKMLYQDGTDSCVWGKLYKKNVFDGIRFPEHEIFEDIAIIFHLLDRVNRVVFSEFAGYFYLQRKSSIIRAKFKEHKMSLIDFMEANEMFLKKYNELDLAIANRMVRASFHIYLQIPGTKEYQQYRERIEKIIIKNRRKVLGDKRAVIGTKVALMISCISFSLVRKLRSTKKWGKAV